MMKTMIPLLLVAFGLLFALTGCDSDSGSSSCANCPNKATCSSAAGKAFTGAAGER